MTSQTWGLGSTSETAPAEPAVTQASKRRKGAKLSPTAARAAHKGIVWLHASAIAVWLFVSLVLGALLLAGKAVPPVVVIAGIGAAGGHALFLLTHLYLAAAARKRAAAAAGRSPTTPA